MIQISFVPVILITNTDAVCLQTSAHLHQKFESVRRRAEEEYKEVLLPRGKSH